ncbi:hypothetical protein WJX82_007175 [Trebouxia sp. C0006]
MDPYQDLRVLQQMSSLTWLRVFVHGDYDPNEYLAFAFPPSLHFLELRCNQKRYSRSGAVYLRTPDRDLLKVCFQADMPLRTVNIKSHGCFAWVGLPDGFVQLRHLQEVILQEAGLNWLPEGPWLQQLKILDLSHNSFYRIPPVLTSCTGALQKLDLYGAREKRPVAVKRSVAVVSHEDASSASSAEGSGSEDSGYGSRSPPSCRPEEREAKHVPLEDAAMPPGKFERFASARGDEAFSAATRRAAYQELLDADIDVQITKAALLDSW